MTLGEQPSVSVVVAARDAESSIGECLESLLALSYPDDRLEIIVVDNDSSDRTAEIARRYGSEVALVREFRRGPAAARNAGISRSRGSVVALTDADCTVDPEWLAALVPSLADRSVGIVGGVIRARRPATPIELFGESIHDHRRAIEVWRPRYVITMNWAARRSVVDELGAFDESLDRCSDVDFAYRAGRAGYEFAFCPEAIVCHRNERSLSGLAREGWTHGFHSAAVLRRHADYIRAELGRGIDPRPRREDRAPLRFRAAFELGRRVGRGAAVLGDRLRRVNCSEEDGSRGPERISA